jgi:transcriptional regulator with XRE-family HTH domain
LVLKRLAAAGITTGALAKALGVSSSAASRMLSGDRGIPMWHLDAIAKLLNTTVRDLLDPACHPAKGSSSNETSANGVLSQVPTAPASSSPEVPRAGKRDPLSSEYFDTAIREISVAVASVETISGQLRELHAHLSERLTALGLAYADLISGQMAVGAPDAPGAHEGVRKHDRHADGTRRRKRKAG